MRDLLVCEHLALQTLANAGVDAARSQILEAAGRVFLESERFDRTAHGRIGMVSLQVYDAEYVGQMDNWADTAIWRAESLQPRRPAAAALGDHRARCAGERLASGWRHARRGSPTSGLTR